MVVTQGALRRTGLVKSDNVDVPAWYSKAPLSDGSQSDRDPLRVPAALIIHIEAGRQKKAPPKRRFQGPDP
jgi:hypothetical protein